MTWANGQRLYELLPAHLRVRDHEQGEPLRALLSVIESELETVEANIEGLYDDWFIETCAEWLVPYIGDLLGVSNLYTVDSAGLYSLRAFVANTLAYRQRKGTAAVLEQLARDVTNWPVRAVEFFQLLATTQHVNHLRPSNHRTPDLRDTDRLELLNSPFDAIAHTGEVRRIGSGRGRYNIINLGLFLWRWGAYFLPRSTPRPASGLPVGLYTFNALDLDAPLFNRPETETTITHLATERNVPAPLRRRAVLEHKLDYLGEQPCFEVFFDGLNPLPPAEIVICNLEGWEKPGWLPPTSDGTTRVAVDPALGRLAVLGGAPSPTDLLVSHTYGYPGDLGGGPYNRRDSLEKTLTRPVTWQMEVNQTAAAVPGQVANTLAAAVAEWNAQPAGSVGLIAVSDSRTYLESLTGIGAIEIPAGSQLHLVAARLPAGPAALIDSVDDLEASALRPHMLGDLSIHGAAETSADPGELVCNGLLVEGTLTVLVGNLGGLQLHHCTLLPGAERLIVNGSVNPADQNDRLEIALERTICGGLNLADTVPALRIVDSIVHHQGGADIVARGADVHIETSTVAGVDDTEATMRTIYASESLFTGQIWVERRQVGCLRFSHVPRGSRTPRRYHCQPDLALENVSDPAEQQDVALRLTPLFTASDALGLPREYVCWLARGCAAEIRTGAADSAEMGAWSHLKQPQREANLRLALEEYLRFGLEAGIFYET